MSVYTPGLSSKLLPANGVVQALIKRVIAVGGDAVQIKDGSLFINGEEQFEAYTFEVRSFSI